MGVGTFVAFGTHISSVSGAGTWTTNTGAFNSNHTDMAYNLNTSSGATTITVTFSGSQSSPDAGAEVCEYATDSKPALLDVVGSVTTPTGCNPCAGLALSITGTNDLIMQFATQGSGTISGIDGTFTDPADIFVGSGRAMFAGSMNTNTGAAPNISLIGSSGTTVAGVAFKESPSGRRPLSF